MEGQVPVEVAALAGPFRKQFEQSATRAGLKRILMTLGRPAVRHRDVHAGVGRMLTQGFPGEADLIFVLLSDLLSC